MEILFQFGWKSPRVIYEHGFQADFANNQASWSVAIGKKITEIVGVMEYLEPDIDVILGSAWESVSRLFTIYNGGLTPVKNPDGFNTHEYLNFYISLMENIIVVIPLIITIQRT